MITFFTTAKPFSGTTGIQQKNSLQSLQHSVPGCQILMYDPVEGSREICEALGIEEPKEVEKSVEGTPRIDAMFEMTAKRARHPISCFLNCDILITPKFAEIVEQLHEKLSTNYLLVGQRIDLENTSPLFPDKDWVSKIEALGATGEIHPPSGMDYFVFPTGQFHWNNMPPLLVGRARWDGWMLYDSLSRGRRVVDLSPSYMVFHQNHDYTHRKQPFTGFKDDPESQANGRFMPVRKRGAHAYHLRRCLEEFRDGQIRYKRLVFPTKKEEQLILGGPDKAASGALETPVVLILFRRPETVKQVIDSLRLVRPKYVYAIADGPNKNEPAQTPACEAARAELGKIDWPCCLRTDFSETNLKLARRVKSGLDWVFSREEKAIILEDDVVAKEGFFRFCEQMLNHYANEPSVYGVSGTSAYPPEMLKGEPYYFSRYQLCWGWATWRRAWEGFDLWMEQWPEHRRKGVLVPQFEDDLHALSYWTTRFDLAHFGKWDSWAYPWMLHCWVANALAICPAVNLTSNIGLGEDATHTREKHIFAEMEIGEMLLPVAPVKKIERHRKADYFLQRAWYERKSGLIQPKFQSAPEGDGWKKPNFLHLLLNIKNLYRFEKITEALRKKDTRYAMNHLKKLDSKYRQSDRGILLEVQTLLTADRENGAIKVLKNAESVVKKNSLLMAVSEFLKQKKRQEFVAENPMAEKAPFSHEPSLRPLLKYPRYTRGACKFKCGHIEFADAASAISAYREIFYNYIYQFSTENNTPRIIDCGANIGLSVIYFKEIFPDAKITAFEADPEIFKILQKNIAACCKGEVELLQKAVWNSAEELLFSQEGADGGALGAGCRIAKVQGVPLGDYLKGPVEFLKMDIEGAEVEALMGVRNELPNVQRLYIEYHSFENKPQRLPELLSLLKETGFRFNIQSATYIPPRPFLRRKIHAGMDNQLHIFGWKPEFEPQVLQKK